MALTTVQAFTDLPTIQYESNPEVQSVVESYQTWWVNHADLARDQVMKGITLLKGEADYYSAELADHWVADAPNRLEEFVVELGHFNANFTKLEAFSVALGLADAYVVRVLDNATANRLKETAVPTEPSQIQLVDEMVAPKEVVEVAVSLPSEVEVQLGKNIETIQGLMKAIVFANSVYQRKIKEVEGVFETIRYQMANEGRLPVVEPVKPKEVVQEAPKAQTEVKAGCCAPVGWPFKV